MVKSFALFALAGILATGEQDTTGLLQSRRITNLARYSDLGLSTQDEWRAGLEARREIWQDEEAARLLRVAEQRAAWKEARELAIRAFEENQEARAREWEAAKAAREDLRDANKASWIAAQEQKAIARAEAQFAREQQWLLEKAAREERQANKKQAWLESQELAEQTYKQNQQAREEAWQQKKEAREADREAKRAAWMVEQEQKAIDRAQAKFAAQQERAERQAEKEADKRAKQQVWAAETLLRLAKQAEKKAEWIEAKTLKERAWKADKAARQQAWEEAKAERTDLHEKNKAAWLAKQEQKALDREKLKVEKAQARADKAAQRAMDKLLKQEAWEFKQQTLLDARAGKQAAWKEAQKLKEEGVKAEQEAKALEWERVRAEFADGRVIAKAEWLAQQEEKQRQKAAEKLARQEERAQLKEEAADKQADKKEAWGDAQAAKLAKTAAEKRARQAARAQRQEEEADRAEAKAKKYQAERLTKKRDSEARKAALELQRQEDQDAASAARSAAVDARVEADMLAHAKAQAAHAAERTRIQKIEDEAKKLVGCVRPEDCDVEELCVEPLRWTTTEANLKYNNLGGMGPGVDEPEEIRFENAANLDGTSLDLVITVRDGAYFNSPQSAEVRIMEEIRPDNVNVNGARGDFGTINVLAEVGKFRNHKFLFEFQDSSSGIPIQVPKTMFTFFDIDQMKAYSGTGAEVLSTCDAANAVTATPTSLIMDEDAGCWSFASTMTEVENVMDSTNMTNAMKEASVIMSFEGVSHFDLDYTNIGKRNFLFEASPTFVCPTTTTTTIACLTGECDCEDYTVFNTNSITLVTNNLGGMGPGVDEPEEIRYANAANLDGQSLDLVITVRDGEYFNSRQSTEVKIMELYKPDNVNVNGVRGDFGTINVVGIRGNLKTHKFRFEFQDSISKLPTVVPKAKFTFFDIDQMKAYSGTGAEVLTSCDASSAEVVEPTSLLMEQDGNCWSFSSTKVEVENVMDSADLTLAMKSASVVITYEDVSHFDVDYTNTGKRNFLFEASPTFVCPATTTTTTIACLNGDCDLEELCKNTVVFDTNSMTLTSNNLAAMGPDYGGPEEIRFASAGEQNGVSIDLVVTVRGNYVNTNQAVALARQQQEPDYLNVNGVRGDFGTVNVLTRASDLTVGDSFTHEFRFDFQDSVTGDPVELKSVMFTFFDIDQAAGARDNAEVITTCDATNAVAALPSTLLTDVNSGCWSFGSTAVQVPNPDDFHTMTDDQKKASVVLEYHDTTGFDLDYTTINSLRNFLFIPHPTFVCENFPVGN